MPVSCPTLRHQLGKRRAAFPRLVGGMHSSTSHVIATLYVPSPNWLFSGNDSKYRLPEGRVDDRHCLSLSIGNSKFPGKRPKNDPPRNSKGQLFMSTNLLSTFPTPFISKGTRWPQIRSYRRYRSTGSCKQVSSSYFYEASTPSISSSCIPTQRFLILIRFPY